MGTADAVAARSTSALTTTDLYRLLGGPHCPLIVDVRKPGAFDDDEAMLPGALRVPPDAVAGWSAPTHAKSIVAYCVHGHEVSQGAAATLAARGFHVAYLDGGIALWREAGFPLMRKSTRFGIPQPRATRWVTRARPKIDRIACPWLVRRFIDPTAQFLYVPAGEVLDVAAREHAIAYDVAGAPLDHDGDACSFDAIIAAFGLGDPALGDLAAIVRGADTGRPGLTPQSHGLLAISLGLSHNHADDHTMLGHGMVIYDALYAWCRQARDGRQHANARATVSA